MRHSLGLVILLVFVVAGCKKSNEKNVATVTTTAVNNITSTSAQTGGDITSNGGTTVTQSGICWATHANPTVGDSIISTGNPNGTFTISMTNLNPNTSYHVRAFAINSVGTGYGQEDSFMTSKGLPTVTTSAVTNIIPLVATSGGNVINDGGATVTIRGLCYSTSPNPTINNFKTSDSTGTGAFIDSMKPLASQTEYYVRAYATNSYGTAYGNQVSFTSSSANTVLDYDGNVYSYVVIGTQTWMTTNLKVTHYRNGDPVINGSTTNFGWYNNYYDSLYMGAYTYANGDSTLTNSYGLLYNVDVVNDKRNIAPPGWHVPTDGEWETLEYYEGMLATDTGSQAVVRNETNPIGPILLPGGASGFNAQIAGRMSIASTGVTYQVLNVRFYYWTSTEYVPTGRILNWIRFLGAQKNIGRAYTNTIAASIRCIKD